MPVAWQIILRCTDNRVLLPTVADRRAFVRALGELARPFELVGFGLPDTHGHALTVGTQAQARELGRRIAIGLSRRLPSGACLERPRLQPVVDQRHLANAFWYVHGQEEHHGLAVDPLHEATSLPDLVGLRTCLPWLRQRVGRWLPRIREEHLVARLAADPWSLPRPEGTELLALAAAAAAGLPCLAGRSASARAARAAAASLTAPQLPQAEVAAALGLSSRQLRRAVQVDPALARAIDGQWRLRHAARQGASVPGLSPAPSAPSAGSAGSSGG